MYITAKTIDIILYWLSLFTFFEISSILITIYFFFGNIYFWTRYFSFELFVRVEHVHVPYIMVADDDDDF